MSNLIGKILLAYTRAGLLRIARLSITLILLIGICLSAAVPITPVFSKSPGIPSARPSHAIIPLACTSGLSVISENMIWSTGNIYTVTNCVVTVNAGVTLTVQAGAVVHFSGTTSGMKVLGTLTVTGGDGLPAVFTSINDNSDSGGSNTAIPGSWYGIVLAGGSSATFDYASIRYGGAYDFNSNLVGWNRAQVDVTNATLVMDHSEIRDGTRDGLVLYTPGRTPSIQNTSISNNSNGNPTDNVGYAIYQSTINMQPTYSNLTFNGNDRNQVVMEIANLTQDVTLGGAPLAFTCGFTSCPIQIPSPFTLTVQPGATLDMTDENAGFAVQSGGSLLVEGTEIAPVTIIEGGIDVSFGGVADLSYCDVGGGDQIYYGLYLRSDDVTVNNCAFHDFYIHGINVYAEMNKSLHLNMTDVVVQDNGDDGIYIGTSSGATFDLSLEGGIISGSGDNGITVGGGPVSITLKDVVVSNNGINGFDWSEKNGIYANTNNVSMILENVQLIENVNESVYWNCNGSIIAKNLSTSGNGRNALVMAGCVLTSGREWDLADAGIPVIVSNWIDVNGGAVLSITPGSKLGFETGKNLQIQPLGALYALGTADKPIVFTRAYDTQTPANAWSGLENYKGTMILRHCEISYSNYWSSYGGRGVGIRLDGSTDIPTNTIIQNCKIHDNEIGIFKTANIQATTSILYNEIYNNPTFGIDWGGYDAVNAYYNYWGSPSGPTISTNPGGTGDKVDVNVNYNPFLTAAPEDQTLVGNMWVSSGGPNTISPGEVNDYAVQYLNLMADPVYGAVAVIQLPLAGKYLSSTEGGTYWPARHQVFWLLGDIQPGSQGMLTARVRFDWGLAGSYRDGSYTILAGSNYNSDQLNLVEYTGYDPESISSIVPSDQATFDIWRASNAELNTLYNTAVSEGFVFIEAYQTNFGGGDVVSTGMMRTPDKKLARILNLSLTGALAITTNGSTFFKMEDLEGGQLTNLLTLERSTWGAWADAQTTSSASSIQATECNYARCLRNCSLKTISIEMMKDAAKGAGVWLLGLPAVSGLLVFTWGAYEAITLVRDVYECHENCNNDPLSGCCNAGDVLWSPSFIGGNGMCERYDCTSSNSFPPGPNRTEGCGTGSRCVAGTGSNGGCKPCTEDTGVMSLMAGPQMKTSAGCNASDINANTPKCSDLTIRVAKDPNALYGPAGDVLPDEVMDYRITYENEGAGDAFGVYIINELPDQLDETTLVINNGGVYMPAERQIFWYISQLGPKGDPTSEGEVTYSVQLMPGLSAGTAVVNQAVVYFPSVPEETPTNTWTNLVYPLVATPLMLETDYMTGVPVTLAGKPSGSLTFALTSSPLGGILEGTLPDLTYTPIENFNGVDFFTFTASVGGETSQPAQVTINVSATGDATAPTVLWVEPTDEQIGVVATSEPIYTIPEGVVYGPVLVAKFSEPVQEATISSTSVIVMGPGDVIIPCKANFDPATNQLTIQLLAPLESEKTYVANLMTAILDLENNALWANYSWQFTTAKISGAGINIYLPMIKR